MKKLHKALQITMVLMFWAGTIVMSVIMFKTL